MVPQAKRASPSSTKTPDLVGTVTLEQRPSTTVRSTDRGPQATGCQNALHPRSPATSAPSTIAPPERTGASDAVLPAFPEGAAELFDDIDDDLRTARGFLNGIVLAVPAWGIIGLVTWLLVGR
jgi:hypothetical protein